MDIRKTGSFVACALLALAAAPLAHADGQEQIDFANGLFARGFYAEAAEEYRAYLDAYPNGARRYDAWYRLGESELASDHHQAALLAFDQVLASPSSEYRDRATLRRSVCQIHLGEYTDAERGLTRVLDKAALAAEANYYLQKVYLADGRVAEAESALKRLESSYADSPLVPFARYQLAFANLEAEEFERAAVQFSAIADTPAAPENLRIESRFRAAETYDRLGWFDAAISAYESLQNQYPDSEYASRAEYGYAWSLYHAGKFAEATITINALIAKGGEPSRIAGLHYLLANAMQSRGDYAGAIAAYQRIRSDDPGSDIATKAHYKLAWTLHLSGDDDAALGQLAALLSKSSDSPMTGDAAYLRGDILAGREDYANAYQEFRLVAAEYPNSEFAPEALFKSGECLALMNRPSDAFSAFAGFAERYPTHALAAEAQLRAGDAAASMGDLGKSIDRYSTIAAMNPSPAVEEESLYRLGVAMHNAANYRVSAETFMKLLEGYPESRYVQEAYLRVADAYLRDVGDPVKAVEYYRSALQGGGTLAGQARRGLALARYESKDYEGATQEFLDLIRAYPEIRLNSRTLQWLGEFRLNAGDWQGSVDALEAHRGLYPDHADDAIVHFMLGEAYGGLGEMNKALAVYRVAAETATNAGMASDARFQIAEIHVARGEAEKAASLYEEAANANTGESSARARFKLGEIAETRGDYGEAARHFMRVAILFLHDELTPKALARAADNYERAGDVQRATETRAELLREFPESAQAALLHAEDGVSEP